MVFSQGELPGGMVKVIVGAAAIAAGIAWVAAPWISMARHGTLDEQALEAMREPVLPAPRKAPDDVRPERPPAPRQEPAPDPAPVPRQERRSAGAPPRTPGTRR
ncbi:hypothetical protein Acsp07_12920 [Actinomycetospora sp. NBRC 106378]|nr:hypothetical protein Acsp07_12920 [Actinomycetospora sp. NBRC 106378]